MQRNKDEIMVEFIGLSNALSPENLHRDGEASKEEVKNSLANINKSWKNLETEIGYTVSEDDVWTYQKEQRKNKIKEQETSVAPVVNLETPAPQPVKKKNFFGV